MLKTLQRLYLLEQGYGQKITIVVNGYNEDNASELVKEYIKNNL